MKKNTPFYSLLMAIPVALFTLVAFTSGQPGQFSGSPGDGGSNCTACHAPGSNYGGTPALTSVPTFYNAGQNYDLNLAINGSSVSKFGFNITAEDVNGVKIGSWTANSANGTRSRSDGSGLTHTSGGSSSNNWNIRWTAPATNQGPVTFYYSTMQANGANGNRNDHTVTGQSTQVLNNVQDNITAFNLYPTVANQSINIQLGQLEQATLTIYSLHGQLISSSLITNNQSIDINHLATGNYIAQISSNGDSTTQQFIKK